MHNLPEKLKEKLRLAFEPSYGRLLSDEEIEEIAENLCLVTEEELKLQWKKKMEKENQQN